MEKIIHSTSTAHLFAKSIEIRLVVTIVEPEIPAGVHGNDITSWVEVELTMKHEEAISEFKHAYSLLAITLWDILDLSICLDHISLRDDTTETLKDLTAQSKHKCRAQWAIHQWLFNIAVLLYSKNTEMYHGKRYVSLRVFADEDRSGVARIVASAVTPEEVRRFASELRACHDQVMSARALFIPEEPVPEKNFNTGESFRLPMSNLLL
jgi:hypothetical protein